MWELVPPYGTTNVAKLLIEVRYTSYSSTPIFFWSGKESTALFCSLYFFIFHQDGGVCEAWVLGDGAHLCAAPRQLHPLHGVQREADGRDTGLLPQPLPQCGGSGGPNCHLQVPAHACAKGIHRTPFVTKNREIAKPAQYLFFCTSCSYLTLFNLYLRIKKVWTRKKGENFKLLINI